VGERAVSRFIDLSYTFEDKMLAFPGDSEPRLYQSEYIADVGYNKFHLETGLHIGTHMDAPFHIIEGGKFISDLPVDALTGRGHLIDAVGQSPVSAEALDGRSLAKGDVVVVMTGHSKTFRTPEFYEGYPEISEEFAEKVVEAGVAIIGLDTPSPDREPYAVHKILLGNGVIIIENLTNLEALVGIDDFRVYAFPPKLRCEASLVRVVAEVH